MGHVLGSLSGSGGGAELQTVVLSFLQVQSGERGGGDDGTHLEYQESRS